MCEPHSGSSPWTVYSLKGPTAGTTPLLGTHPHGGGSTGNVVVLSSINWDCGDNGTKGCHVTDGVSCAAVRSWCLALPSAIHQGCGSGELKLSFKLLEWGPLPLNSHIFLWLV